MEVIPEESPVGLSQANGDIERANFEIASKVRTLRFHAEELHKVKLGTSHPLLAWAVEYAPNIPERSHRSAIDGKTAYERRKGKSYKRSLPSWS